MERWRQRLVLLWRKIKGASQVSLRSIRDQSEIPKGCQRWTRDSYHQNPGEACMRFTIKTSRRNQPYQCLHFRLAAFRTVRGYISCFKPPSMWYFDTVALGNEYTGDVNIQIQQEDFQRLLISDASPGTNSRAYRVIQQKGTKQAKQKPSFFTELTFSIHKWIREDSY